MLYFKSPNSYTGEDMVELQVHGGNAVKGKILEELGSIETFR
jgi:tRNA modification GTPase